MITQNKLNIVFAVHTGFLSLDYLTTELGLTFAGIYELNPFVTVFKPVGVMFLGFLASYYIYTRKNVKQSYYVLLALSLIRFGVVLSNFYILSLVM